MIDFHAHVLPNVDDGAKNISESCQILKDQKEQGIETVVATSHCFRGKSITKFVQKRDAAYEALMAEVNQDEIPNIVLGSELALYYGLSEQEDLRLACIQNTDYVLLELPMEHWGDWIYDEIYKICIKHHVKPIIAHLDRYISKKNVSKIEKLLNLDVIIQINAEALLRFTERRFVKRIWNEKGIILLGSDCHNMTDRKCKLGKAFGIAKRLLGNDACVSITDAGAKILQNQSIM